MNFSVNFMEKANLVLKEALKLKKYKAMPKVLAILTAIFMLPLIVAGYIFAGFVFIFGYLYNVASQPVQALHNLLQEEGQKVKHGTQVVVYFLSWATVFGAYVALAFLRISLTIQYTIFSILTYLWTLGGFKFHAFVTDEDISIEVNDNYKLWVPVAFVSVMGVLLILVPAINTISFFIENNETVQFTLKALWNVFKMKLHATDNIRNVFAALYSAIVFTQLPKKTEE